MKRKKRTVVNVENEEATIEIFEEHDGGVVAVAAAAVDDEDHPVVINHNPGKDKVTIVAGSMMNFASAIKWLHKFINVDIGKVRYRISEEVVDEIKHIMATYKRDVGEKRRKGVMKVREGKDPVSLVGYEHICKWLYQMKPVGHKGRWSESLFVNLYLRLQCATIGRTDNISSLLLSHVEWSEDALTITFSTTKSDQAGERTNERKHVYASSDMPHVCVFLAMALFMWYDVTVLFYIFV
jgi:hypothetical protein